jgi:hypothetical protein
LMASRPTAQAAWAFASASLLGRSGLCWADLSASASATPVPTVEPAPRATPASRPPAGRRPRPRSAPSGVRATARIPIPMGIPPPVRRVSAGSDGSGGRAGRPWWAEARCSECGGRPVFGRGMCSPPLQPVAQGGLVPGKRSPHAGDFRRRWANIHGISGGRRRIPVGVSDEFFEGLEHMGWAAVFRRLAGRPVGTRRPTYTPRPMMATCYQCLCDRPHPHAI